MVSIGIELHLPPGSRPVSRSGNASAFFVTKRARLRPKIISYLENRDKSQAFEV